MPDIAFAVYRRFSSRRLRYHFTTAVSLSYIIYALIVAFPLYFCYADAAGLLLRHDATPEMIFIFVSMFAYASMSRR